MSTFEPVEGDDARIKRANDQAARYRVERNQLREELEALEQQLAALTAEAPPEPTPRVGDGPAQDPLLTQARTLANRAMGRQVRTALDVMKHNPPTGASNDG